MSWAADEGFEVFCSHHGIDGWTDAHEFRQRHLLRELRAVAERKLTF